MPAPRKPLPPELVERAFTRGAALQHGVSPGVLRGPGVQRLAPGIYLDASAEIDLKGRLSAYLALLPEGTAVDGVSALQLLGVDIGEEQPYRFVTTAVYQSKRTELRVRRTGALPEGQGPVVAPLSALVAARLELDLVDLVVAGDWLVQLRRTTLEDVQQALAEASGRHCRRARRAAELVSRGSESPRETRLRLMMVLAGLPVPECNVALGDDWFSVARVDLYLRPWQIAVEYEGDHHRTDATTYGNDLTRYEGLAALGVLAIRVSKAHLRSTRDVVMRIYRALVARGYAGPGPDFGPEWRAAFERPR